VLQQYCHKGSKLFLEGELEIRTYTDQDGRERQATELIVGRFNGQLQLLDRKEDTPQGRGGEGRAGANGGYRRGDPAAGLDDDIPFAPQVD
jgi:single-strand DNA-binding protein